MLKKGQALGRKLLEFSLNWMVRLSSPQAENNMTDKTTKPKVLSGTVVSTKMKDTAVVLVERYEKHPKYEKFIKRRKKFKAHNVGNTLQIGDKVEIIETRPISKDKHFRVVDKLEVKS